MTQGADTREVLVKSSVMAVAATLLTLPYFHYLIFVVLEASGFPQDLNPWGFLFAQLFLLFIVCLLSAVVGFSFSKRLKLPGFGDPRFVIRSIPLFLILGAIVIALSYFLFDRHFLKISPMSYPKDVLYLISFAFKEVFPEEIILRLCLVTLSVGLLKSKGAGVGLVSVLAPIFSVKYFHFMGIEVGLDYLFITQYLLSFSANLLLGYLFVTHGLLYSMALKFVFGMKYMLVAWAM